MNIQFVHSNITGGHYAFKSDKSDKPFVNKMTEALLIELNEKDIVVDIGAYVGEYSLYAARKGVKKIFAYEPTPQTFKVLSNNTKLYRVIKPINKAVTGQKGIKNIQLFTSKGIGVTNSIAKTKGTSIIVPTIFYNQAIKNATVVKIDCEGAEYEFDIIQPKLRALTLEFHPITGVNWVQNAKHIMKNIRNAGFKPLKEPKFENGWDMHGTWVKI
jgi:FkbM family methyltransferase